MLKITAPHLPNIGYQEYDTGHGKLSAHLDLRYPRDLEILRGLVREADVFSQGYRPGTLGNRGLSPEELLKLRPGLVYISMCAFSHIGPWASRRGFDTVVQTVSGITTRQGEFFPGAEPGPQFYPVSAIDYLTGYLMAFGAMVALARRAREGGSWLVRISLAQTGRWLVDRGEVSEAALKDVPKEIPKADIDRWSIESDTPVGRLRHSGRPCASPRPRLAGPARPSRSAITSPCGRPGRHSRHSFLCAARSCSACSLRARHFRGERTQPVGPQMSRGRPATGSLRGKTRVNSAQRAKEIPDKAAYNRKSHSQAPP